MNQSRLSLYLVDIKYVRNLSHINEMIPVRADVIKPLIIKPEKFDDEKTLRYKKMAIKQLSFCQKNQDAIVRRATRLYDLITSDRANYNLKKRCCDFIRLESVLARYKNSSQPNNI